MIGEERTEKADGQGRKSKQDNDEMRVLSPIENHVGGKGFSYLIIPEPHISLVTEDC